jgi:leader peptidase (prepilin peptidase)/N-methyltransferase
MDLLISIWVFAFGAIISSFLNVVIWRVPRGESVVSPPSHCPACGAKIRWWCNIPVLSYIFLRGKCFDCKKPYSPRYAIVEFMGGALFLFCHLMYSWWYAPFLWVWISLMIVGSFIDIDHYLLPDFVTVGGMIYGVLLSFFFAVLPEFISSPIPQPSPFPGIWMSLSGLAFGTGIMWLLRFVGSKIAKREALGMGDVLLLGAIGAIFGPVAALFTLMVSSVFGSSAGVLSIAFARGRVEGGRIIPYGPYICLACVVWIFSGSGLVQWYLKLIGIKG